MSWIRLNIVVEGPTEEEFANEILKPYLSRFSISVIPRMVSHPPKARKEERTLRKHKGGLLDFEWLRKDLDIWMREDRSPETHFTTMIDLYGYPRNAPRYDEAKKLAAYEKVALLEQGMAESFDSARFIPYIQLHEFETLLFSDVCKWNVFFLEGRDALTDLAESVAQFENVEMINDDEKTAPSKRIKSHLPDYDKVLAGNVLAIEIGLPVMREKCRHFNEWLARLESLGDAS